MIPPVAVPPVAATDRVNISSPDMDPFITDTLILTLPASSRTEQVVWSKPNVTSSAKGEKEGTA